MERAKARGSEQLKYLTFKALCANIRSFSEHCKSAYSERQLAGVTFTPCVTEEADERWDSLSGDEDAEAMVKE